MALPCLYELFCLAKPRLGQPQLAEVIKAVSTRVLEQGGVITDIKSFGERPLAYDVRKPGERHSEVRPGRVGVLRRGPGMP